MHAVLKSERDTLPPHYLLAWAVESRSMRLLLVLLQHPQF
jgi:hypothetical protein